jgi:hypothetical protein
MAGRSDAEILGDIRASIPPGNRYIPDREIMDAVRKARREIKPGTPSQCYRIPRPAHSKPIIDGPAYLKKLIARGDGAGPVDLWHLSDHQPDRETNYCDALAVLSLYDAEEHIYIGDQYGRDVEPVETWRTRIEQGQVAPWPHIAPNPFDGVAHDIGNRKPSFRCDAAVSAFRYVVVEFDTVSKSDQLAFWYAIITARLLPVAVLLDSGGKSLHAWIRVDLPDRQAWNREVCTRFYGDQGVFTSMGADRACRNPSRLSRLPGHYRTEKNSYQTLLYLNPQTKATV